MRLKRYEEALETCVRLIALKPDVAHHWGNKEHVLFRLKRYQEALAASDQALALDPKNPQGWLNRSAILSRLRRRGDALEAGRHATQVVSDSAEAWAGWAGIAFRHRRYDEAISASNRAIALQPQNVNAVFARFLALLFSGHFLQAWEALKDTWRAVGETEPSEEMLDRWPFLRPNPKKTDA